ncbi:MAG: hypothetical protein KDA53_08320 [Hyphomonas sp.]|nr:hypothetical protein [Hyphomonas sp.]
MDEKRQLTQIAQTLTAVLGATLFLLLASTPDDTLHSLITRYVGSLASENQNAASDFYWYCVAIVGIGFCFATGAYLYGLLLQSDNLKKTFVGKIMWHAVHFCLFVAGSIVFVLLLNVWGASILILTTPKS